VEPGRPGAAADLVPGGLPLLGRHVHGAGQVQKVGGAGQDGPPALDPEDDVVAFAEPERLADRPGDGDLPLEVSRAETSMASISLLLHYRQ